jgi:hypothetical protein
LVELKRQFPRLKFIYFSDSLINGDMRELERFCDLMIAHDVRVSWGGHTLVRLGMTASLMRHKARAGANRLNFGVESGSDTVLKLMRKGFRSALALEVLQNTRQAGIAPSVNLIVGHPGETEIEFEETRRFHRKLKGMKIGVHVNPCPTAVSFNQTGAWPILATRSDRAGTSSGASLGLIPKPEVRGLEPEGRVRKH